MSGAPWAALAWHQFRLERRVFWRNPSAAFFNFLLPLLLLGLFGAVFSGRPEDLDVIVPGIAGMSVMSTTFTALAMNLVALREQGILKRVRGTPLPSSAYLAGLGLHALVNALTQLALVTVIGALAFGVAWPKDVGSMLVFAMLGVGCFGMLGVALSHAIPGFDSAPAYVNAIFLPVVVLSGVFYDEQGAPEVLREVARALPLTHLIDGLSGAMVSGTGVGSHVGAVAVLLVWGAVGTVLAVRGFSWDARRS